MHTVAEGEGWSQRVVTATADKVTRSNDNSQGHNRRDTFQVSHVGGLCPPTPLLWLFRK
jgi:hypothetical protein